MVAPAALGANMIRISLFLFLLVAMPTLADNFVLIVQGLGGTADYEKQFARDAKALMAAAALSGDTPERRVFLGGTQATRDNIAKKIDTLSGAMTGADSFSMTLIGHGSFDGNEYKFNLPGADLSGSEISTALGKIPARRQLLVIATSSSGAMLERLSAHGRIVITATRNGRESNAVTFARHWAGALVSESADINKDELLSAYEAFRFAEKKIDEYYKSERLLASEHPRMISDYDSEFYLARIGRLAGSENNYTINALLAERGQLAEQFYTLKNRKSRLTESEYLDSLQAIMLQMARLQTIIDDELADEKDADEES